LANGKRCENNVTNIFLERALRKISTVMSTEQLAAQLLLPVKGGIGLVMYYVGHNMILKNIIIEYLIANILNLFKTN